MKHRAQPTDLSTKPQVIGYHDAKTEKKRFTIKLLQPTGHVMHQQFNIQQLYALPTYLLTYSKERSP
jgi:hypothetical protein